MSRFPDSYYYASRQEDYPSNSYEDSAPSYWSYGPYYATGQEVGQPVPRESMENMTPYFKDDGVGLGITYPDYSEYYDTTTTPTPDTYHSAENTSTNSLSPPPIDPHLLGEEDSLTSLFRADEDREAQLINPYATDEAEEKKEDDCTFGPQACFFCNVANSALRPFHPTPEPAYEYQNTDSTPKANSNPKAFSASSFRDEYLSHYCYNGQRKSVTSGTVTYVNAAEAAQVAEISHINELTPRNAGGSFTRRCLEKAVSPKTYSKFFKRAAKN
ncbi:hypothetical protein FPOAC2_12844 [Fusarium poae]|uniref:hypothetical protein n=1 Tax=Fusarium poae TaxID=36050 RepID=UPI001CEAA01B|nr:hypothetical protein FPOAC1_012494 [Fusarium poae]KAG8667661.1 hypothetical protein FPOAC1_012494 [Fusarium poae]